MYLKNIFKIIYLIEIILTRFKTETDSLIISNSITEIAPNNIDPEVCFCQNNNNLCQYRCCCDSSCSATTIQQWVNNSICLANTTPKQFKSSLCTNKNNNTEFSKQSFGRYILCNVLENYNEIRNLYQINNSANNQNIIDINNDPFSLPFIYFRSLNIVNNTNNTIQLLNNSNSNFYYPNKNYNNECFNTGYQPLGVNLNNIRCIYKIRLADCASSGFHNYSYYRTTRLNSSNNINVANILLSSFNINSQNSNESNTRLIGGGTTCNCVNLWSKLNYIFVLSGGQVTNFYSTIEVHNYQGNCNEVYQYQLEFNSYFITSQNTTNVNTTNPIKINSGNLGYFNNKNLLIFQNSSGTLMQHNSGTLNILGITANNNCSTNEVLTTSVNLQFNKNISTSCFINPSISQNYCSAFNSSFIPNLAIYKTFDNILFSRYGINTNDHLSVVDLSQNALNSITTTFSNNICRNTISEIDINFIYDSYNGTQNYLVKIERSYKTFQIQNSDPYVIKMNINFIKYQINNNNYNLKTFFQNFFFIFSKSDKIVLVNIFILKIIFN